MSTTPGSTNSFDKVDRLMVVPSSSRKSKVVSLAPKVLETKKEARKVLPEEKYVANLERLITRDYFPDLPKLRAQAEFMEAVARDDHVKIRELQIRYCTQRSDRRTSRPSTSATSIDGGDGGGRRMLAPSPSVFDPDTPGPSTLGDGESLGGDAASAQAPYANMDGDNEALMRRRKKKSALDSLTVQSYLDKYTSEDNASFEELAEMHNKRERVRNAWMYEAEERHNRELAFVAPPLPVAADEQLLAIANAERERPKQLDNWSYTARNAVLFHPEEAPLTLDEFIQRAKQNERIINKEATRFKFSPMQQPNEAAMARAAFKQAGVNSGRVDILGQDVGVVGQSTLGLVATPSPMPGVDESPLMTWGEIEGTPFRLDAPDMPPGIGDAPAFKIPEVPVRERVAQDIADQIARRYHGRRKHAMEQVEKLAPRTPKFASSTRSSTSKLSGLSPAARRLATGKLGIRVGTEKSIKMSPKTPGSQRSAVFSPAIHKLVKVKREASSVDGPNPTGSTTPARPCGVDSVTDNLFALPPSPLPVPSANDEMEGMEEEDAVAARSRPAAKDFF